MLTQPLSSIIEILLKSGLVIMWACLVRYVTYRGDLGIRAGKAAYAFRRIRRATSVTLQQNQRQPSRTISSLSLSFGNGSDTSEEENPHENLALQRPPPEKEERTMGYVQARVLPREYIEYETRKPHSHSVDANNLIRLYREATRLKNVPVCAPQNKFACCEIGPLKVCGKEPGENGEDWIVNIDASIDYINDGDEFKLVPTKKSVNTTASHTEAQTSINNFQMHMNRNALEPAIRTLWRLEVSTFRKYKHERGGRGNRSRSKKEECARYPRQRTSRPKTSSSILVPIGMIGGENNGDEISDVSFDGYRGFNLSGKTSAEVWKSIASKVEDNPCTRKSSFLKLAMPDGTSIPLQLESCPPTIMSVETFEAFESRLFVGVPLVVQTEVLHAKRAVVSWFTNGELTVCDSLSYTPTEADIGKQLSVLIVPIRPGHDGGGHEEAYQFSNPIEPLPFMPLVSPLRDEWTTPRSKDSYERDFRLVTYNLLADLYTSREVDQKLMYNHCHPVYLCKKRRMPMLLYEMLSYHADVICLQEVDANIYTTLFLPVLESQGYQGFYSNKASSQLEGCAMFWSLRCFERAKPEEMLTFTIRDLFGVNGEDSGDEQEEKIIRLEQSPSPTAANKAYTKWDSMDSIDHLLKENDELRRVTREKTGQVLQVASLTLRTSAAHKPEKVVLGNTHLFYHPMADHVRAMQAFVVCKQMDAVRRNGGSSFQDKHQPYPLVLCGDLNSNPMSGAIHLLLQRRLRADHFQTWKHLHDYSWEMGDYDFMLEHGYVGNDVGEEPVYLDEAFEDAREYLDEEHTGEPPVPPLVLPPSFPKLFSGYPHMPQFTNYAIDFIETLDYILASEPTEQEPFGFGPKRSAPMPTEEEVTRYVAMPNEFMPSDHASMVCDLEWKHYTENK